MAAAARAAGLPMIAPVFDPDLAEAARQKEVWLGRGCRIFAVATDKILFATSLLRQVDALG